MPSHLHTVIKQNGIITTDKFKLVNHLNDHFVKVGCAFEDNPCIPTPSSINLAPTTRLPILAPPLLPANKGVWGASGSSQPGHSQIGWIGYSRPNIFKDSCSHHHSSYPPTFSISPSKLVYSLRIGNQLLSPHSSKVVITQTWTATDPSPFCPVSPKC